MTEAQMIDHSPRNKENPSPTMEQQGEEHIRLMKRFYLIGAILITLVIIDGLLTYNTYQAWQILVDTVGIFIGLILLQASRSSYFRGRENLAYSLLPLVVFFVYAPGEFVFLGTTFYNLISGTLILILTGMILRPKNLSTWVGLSIFYIISILAASQLQIFQRFDITQSASWQTGSLIGTAVFLFGIFLQFIMNIQRGTIRTRLLIAFIALGLIPAVIAASTSSTLGFQYGREQAVNQLNAQAIFKQEELNIYLENQHEALNSSLKSGDAVRAFYRFISAPMSPISAENAYNQVLRNLQFTVEETSAFDYLFVIDTQGNVLISTNQELEGQNLSEDPLFINGKVGKYTQAIQTDENNEPFLDLSQPILSESGLTIGVIAGQLNFDKINDIVSADTGLLGMTGEMYLVAKNFTLLTDVQEEGFAPGNSRITSTGSETAIASSSIGSGVYNNYNDTEVVGVFRWIPELQAVLIAEQAQSEAFQAIRLNLLINVIITLIATTVAIGIALFVTRSIAGPISELATSAKRVAAGDLEQSFVVERQDEIGDLGTSLNEMTVQLRRSLINLESMVAERTNALERRAQSLHAAAEVGNAVTQIYNLDDLLTSVTHLISERFDFYHVGVFLLDETSEYAILRAANSEGGWRMLARGHKLKVGEQGIVGYATGNRKPRIQQKVGDDNVYYDNPDLPRTRSEMALPLISGGELLGALDIQSTQESAFIDEDIEVMQVLADQVAMAISNTRLFEQLQLSLESERRIYGELSQEAWQELLQSNRAFYGYRSDDRGTQKVETGWKLESIQALEQKKAVQKPATAEGFYPLAVPVKIRGDLVVAVLETEKLVSSGPWTRDEIDAIEAICSQLGIALENARLYEETQRLAQRERIAADVSGKVWASSDVNTILQTVVQELGRSLNASQGTIRLKLPDENGQDGVQTMQFGDLEE